MPIRLIPALADAPLFRPTPAPVFISGIQKGPPSKPVFYLTSKLDFFHPPILLVPPEFSISSFCTVVDVMNFSKLQVLRLDGNEIKRSAVPADAPLCLRLASVIEI